MAFDLLIKLKDERTLNPAMLGPEVAVMLHSVPKPP